VEKQEPRPAWRFHGAMLALSAVAGVCVVSSQKGAPPRSYPGGLVGLVENFGGNYADAMRELRILAITLQTVIGYALVTTILVYLLRRRRGATYWVHGACTVLVLALVGSAI